MHHYLIESSEVIGKCWFFEFLYYLIIDLMIEINKNDIMGIGLLMLLLEPESVLNIKMK